MKFVHIKYNCAKIIIIIKQKISKLSTEKIKYLLSKILKLLHFKKKKKSFKGALTCRDQIKIYLYAFT